MPDYRIAAESLLKIFLLEADDGLWEKLGNLRGGFWNRFNWKQDIRMAAESAASPHGFAELVWQMRKVIDGAGPGNMPGLRKSLGDLGL